MKSTSGGLYEINKKPLSWIAKKQTMVAQSSCEAELVAFNSLYKEGVWLKKILQEVKLIPNSRKYIIYVDSQSAMKLCDSKVVHDRTKHIEIRHTIVKWAVQLGIIEVQYEKTETLVADMFTKELARPAFEKKRAKLNIVSKDEIKKSAHVSQTTMTPKRVQFNTTPLTIMLIMILSFFVMIAGSKAEHSQNKSDIDTIS